MTLRQLLRNKITGFVFGKYDLEVEADRYLIAEEEMESGIEIIHYNEILYFLSIVLVLGVMIFSLILSPYFLFLLLVPIYNIFLATELELVILTNERVIIDRRGWFEKLLNTSNIQAINIDQIAVISYSRAPFQIPSIIIGLILILTPFALTLVEESFLLITVIFQMVLVLPLGAYLVYFGLRLNKRSIEMYVIGITHSIGIGRKKGAIVSFLEELQNIIFERVHHAFHATEDHSEIQLSEFPLEYSGAVKELIDKTRNQLEKKILILLDKANTSKRDIYAAIDNVTVEEIDLSMRQLRRKRLIFYDRSKNVWCLNREFAHEMMSSS